MGSLHDTGGEVSEREEEGGGGLMADGVGEEEEAAEGVAVTRGLEGVGEGEDPDVREACIHGHRQGHGQ